MRRIVLGTSLTFSGLFGGFLLGVLVLELTLRSHDARTYTQVRHIELVGLDALASATLLPALIATTVLVALTARGRRRGFWLATAAGILLLAVLVTSLLVNLPINNDQLGWQVRTPPSDWASVRDAWQTAHVIRTVAAVLAFSCLTAAATANPSSTALDQQGKP